MLKEYFVKVKVYTTIDDFEYTLTKSRLAEKGWDVLCVVISTSQHLPNDWTELKLL